MNGIIVVNKERGYSSFDVIAVLRGVLGMKKLGHTGTLDPEAEGVLPVCLGFATKVCDYLMAQKKEYVAHGRLGITTDTQDIHGTVLSEKPFHVTEEAFRSTLSGFIGEIEQLTPMYSARKIDGVKLVDLARRGITVDRSKKKVRIYEAELLSFDETTGEYAIRILCQKGTYIRTICNDIGEQLGCGSCMTSLVRTATGRFTLEHSYTIDDLRRLRETGRLTEAVVPIDAMYLGCRPFSLDPDQLKSIRNGNFLEPEWLTPCEEPVPEQFRDIYENLLGDDEAKCIRVYSEGEFYAVYQKRGRRYRPLQMYHEVDNELNRLKKASAGQNTSDAVASDAQQVGTAADNDAAEQGFCVSIGKFDGLHLGHRRLIDEMRRTGLPCMLLSVEPQPVDRAVLTENECRALATALGIEKYEIWPLTDENRKLSPEEFVRDVLIGQYHAKEIAVGEDFRFGRDRAGDAVALRAIASSCGVECSICPLVIRDGGQVSSSRIRGLISEGDVAAADALLGEPYFIEGTVVKGKQIGHTIGFPTVNLLPPAEKLLPPFGVYRTKTTVRGRAYRSVTNIGDNPSVHDGTVHSTTIETHILDFNEELYGETIRVSFLDRLRGQVAFTSLEELKAQLAKDIASVREQ